MRYLTSDRRFKVIGIICEFNPFHNGHLYFINQIKKKYPDYLILLVLNGYFTQRGEVSLLSKEDKTRIALQYGVDIVVEHQVMYSTQSADYFAFSAVNIIDRFCCEKIIFGSESCDIKKLEKLADIQLNNPEFNLEVRMSSAKGLSYPEALAKAINMPEFEYSPNDILGIAYIKAIKKNKFNLLYETLQRTNDFHDTKTDAKIVSASNIREKLKENKNIDKYVPKGVKEHIVTVDYQKYFDFAKLKIITDKNISNYMDVTPEIHNRLNKYSKYCYDFAEFKEKIKIRKYTYNRMQRMLVHMYLGIEKKLNFKLEFDYIKILGFNDAGKNYIKKVKRRFQTSHSVDKYSLHYIYEERAALLYELITGKRCYEFEYSTKPIFYEKDV